MRHLIIAILFLLPFTVSAQLLRSYGVVEIGVTFPSSTSTGAKFAYRTTDSSFYRWIVGSTWVKVVEPSIIPDTLYLTESIGTSYKVSGDTINLTPYLLKSDTTAMLVKYIERGDTASMLTNYPSTAGYGIIDGGKTWRADTTSPNGLATRLFARTLPTIIAANYIATSNGSNLVARNLFDNDTYAGVLNSKPWKFGSWTTAGRPTGTDGYYGKNTTTGFLEGYYTSQWENLISSTGASANQVPYFTSAGQIAGNSNYTVNATTGEQTITFNNTATDRYIFYNATTPLSSGNGSFGLRYHNNNQLTFGLFSGARITWTGSGSQASMFGAWNFPGNTVYPANVYLAGSSSGGNDVRWVISRSGTGANQVIYAFTQRYAAADQAPHLNFGATSYVFGTRNTTTAWNTAVDTTTGYIAQNGDFWLGRRSPSNAYWNPPTTQARLNVVGRGTATTYPLLLLENLSGTDRFSVLENGEVRIPTLSATPTRIVGADGDGDLGAISLSSDVTISSGTLGVKNIGNTDLALTGNRTLHGGGNTLRLHANTVVRDSLKVANLADHIDPDSIVTTSGGWLGKKKFLKDAANYFDGTTEGFYFDGDVIGYDVVSGSNYAGTHIEPEYYETTTYNSAGDYSSVFGRLDGMNTYAMMEVSYLTNNGQLYLDVDDGAVIYWGSGGAGNTFQSLPNGTQRFHKYGVGNKEASDISKTQSNYISSFATDGTLLDLNLGTGLSLSGGSLTAQNIFNTNGTFTGSRTVDAAGYALRFNNISSLGLAASNHTSEIGNATLFQRKKLTASESKYYDAYYQYDSRSSISNGSNVAVGPSYSRLFVYKLGGSESYEWTDMHTLDTTNSVFGHMYGARYTAGLSAFRAIRPSSGSAYRLTPAFDFKLEASGNGASGANVLDVRVGNDTLFSVKQNGTVELDSYGAGTINSTTLGTYPTSVAGITENGTLTNYKFARDTFIEDVTLFSVGTLLYDCQELTIVSSMTSLAPTNQEIRFPDAADYLRGKKIIVYSKKKDAGAYVPYISVVGGVSRLFYTTNPAVGGTDPSNQATLYIDDSTWSDHGTTFEFTCLKINSTDYRWVLKQR